MRTKLVILDLDNTLYDWTGYYIPSFLAMVAELGKITGLDLEKLKASFKQVHERHHTTEYSFSIEELDVLRDIDKDLSTAQKLQKYDAAIHAFRKKRLELLRLYEGVAETLKWLKEQDCRIAALTDTTEFYGARRLRQLGIEQHFDVICATRDHGIPAGVDPSEVRSYGDSERYETSIPSVVATEGIRKPQVELIRMILRSTDVEADEAVMVGDSLYRDIKMAQTAGVWDVYARYGNTTSPDLYKELLKITCWTKEEVAEYERLTADVVNPTFVIDSFSELIKVVRQVELRSELPTPARPSSKFWCEGESTLDQKVKEIAQIGARMIEGEEK
jgi:FMN phosphatase YigB (HAD superfamily)